MDKLFGTSVSISGDIALVGTIGDATCGFSGARSAYVFRYDGISWVEEAKLHASDPAAGDSFGGSVSVSGQTALIGAPADDDNGLQSGSAYVFHGMSDCNENDMLDICDIVGGTSDDVNGNGIPDECEGTSSTVSASLTCLPSTGTLPFSTQLTATLTNNYSGQLRRLAARINFTLASGGYFANWRAGYTNVAAGGSFVMAWNQNLPALGTLVGDNLFELVAADVTPAPYNQPPYPAAGDTDTDSCTVSAVAP